MEEQPTRGAGPATPTDPPQRLAGPEMSADNGLSGLGLVMQLGGMLYLGLMAFITLATFIAGRGAQGTWVVLLLGVTGIVRSSLHFSAGKGLLSGRERTELGGGPLQPTMVYIWAALAQTVLVLLVFKAKLHMPGKQLFMLTAILAAWPLTLLAVVNTRRIQAFANRIPYAEDRGFEGVAIYMLLFGIMGAIFSGMLVILLFELPEGAKGFEWMLLLVTAALLVVRSVVHARAGARGLTSVNPYAFSDATVKYTSWGFGTAILAGCVIFIILMKNRGDASGMMLILLASYLLFAWPLIVRTFFQERSLMGLGTDPAEAEFRRSPDRGMTALGWLLLALGVVGLASALPGALFGLEGNLANMRGAELFAQGDLAAAFGRSQWWSVVVGGVQVWAAFELINMTERWKSATMIYGAIATAVTLYVCLPLFKQLQHMGEEALRGGFFQALVFGQVALSLVVPIAAILLANRRLTDGDAATARLHRDGD